MTPQAETPHDCHDPPFHSRQSPPRRAHQPRAAPPDVVHRVGRPAIDSARYLVETLALPIAAATLAASAAYAGADATFAPALTKFTYSLCSIYVPMRFG